MLPACVGEEFEQAARAARPWAQRLRPAAPSPGPSDTRGFAGRPQRWGQEHRALRWAGRDDGASLTAAAAVGRDGLCAWSSTWRHVRSGSPLGDLLFFWVLGFFFSVLLAKQLSKTPGCGKARTAQVAPRGPACSTRSGSGERKREQQGCKKGGKKKKNEKKKGHQQSWERKATGERDSARHHSTCHRRQTDRQPRADQIRKISPLRDPH